MAPHWPGGPWAAGLVHSVTCACSRALPSRHSACSWGKAVPHSVLHRPVTAHGLLHGVCCGCHVPPECLHYPVPYHLDHRTVNPTKLHVAVEQASPLVTKVACAALGLVRACTKRARGRCVLLGGVVAWKIRRQETLWWSPSRLATRAPGGSGAVSCQL